MRHLPVVGALCVLDVSHTASSSATQPHAAPANEVIGLCAMHLPRPPAALTEEVAVGSLAKDGARSLMGGDVSHSVALQVARRKLISPSVSIL
jgi:hypothetical protein